MSVPLDTIVTARLLGTRISPIHFQDVRRLHRDPRVMATLSADGQPLPDEVTRDGLNAATLHWEEHQFGLWVFHDRRDGRFVGRGGLKVYHIDGKDVVGLAYAVVSERFGQGFATEIGAVSLDVGFQRVGLAQVESWTLPANGASRRVLDKLGFRYQRDFEFVGLPHRYYRIEAAQWLGSRG